MVELRLLASEYKCCNGAERGDRDEMAMEMAKEMCVQYLSGSLRDGLYLMVSFFSTLVYYEFMEYLKEEGLWALCEVETGVDRVVRVAMKPKDAPLWTGQM